VYAFAGDALPCTVLLAASGGGAHLLARCAPLGACGAGGGGGRPAVGGACNFVVGGGEDARVVEGARELQRAAGLSCLAQVVIGSPAAPLGALLVARRGGAPADPAT
jgi:hypothetical protein